MDYPYTHNAVTVEDMEEFLGDSSAPTKTLTPKEHIQQQKELKKKEEEENLTFKPRIKLLEKKSGGGESVRPPEGQAFQSLYDDAQKRLEIAKKKLSSPTPVKNSVVISNESINRLYSAAGAGRPVMTSTIALDDVAGLPKPPSTAGRAASVGRSGQRMFAQAEADKRKKEVKMSLLEEKINAECTFAPAVNKPRPSSAVRQRVSTVPGGADPQPAPGATHLNSRMKRFLEEKNSRLELARKMKEEEENKSMTFKPDLSSTSGSTPAVRAAPSGMERSSTPTRERWGVRQTGDGLTRPMPAERTATATTTSTPVRSYEHVTTIFDRLSKGDSSLGTTKINQPHQSSGEKTNENNTFQPTLYTKRAGSAVGSVKSPGPSVHDRLFQQGVAMKKEHKDQEEAAVADELAKCTFSPQLPSSAGHGAVTTSPIKSISSTFERLSSVPKGKSAEELEQMKLRQEEEQCTFQPKVSGLASNMSRSVDGDVHLRLSAQADKLKEEAQRKHELMIQEELKGLTFSPSIPDSSKALLKERKAKKAVPSTIPETHDPIRSPTTPPSTSASGVRKTVSGRLTANASSPAHTSKSNSNSQSTSQGQGHTKTNSKPTTHDRHSIDRTVFSRLSQGSHIPTASPVKSPMKRSGSPVKSSAVKTDYKAHSEVSASPDQQLAALKAALSPK